MKTSEARLGELPLHDSPACEYMRERARHDETCNGKGMACEGAMAGQDRGTLGARARHVKGKIIRKLKIFYNYF